MIRYGICLKQVDKRRFDSVAALRRIGTVETMPRLSEFYGIVITMYWRDHVPPHYHATYGDYEALIIIDDGACMPDPSPGERCAWSGRGTAHITKNFSKPGNGRGHELIQVNSATAMKKIRQIPRVTAFTVVPHMACGLSSMTALSGQ